MSSVTTYIWTILINTLHAYTCWWCWLAASSAVQSWCHFVVLQLSLLDLYSVVKWQLLWKPTHILLVAASTCMLYMGSSISVNLRRFISIIYSQLHTYGGCSEQVQAGTYFTSYNIDSERKSNRIHTYLHQFQRLLRRRLLLLPNRLILCIYS